MTFSAVWYQSGMGSPDPGFMEGLPGTPAQLSANFTLAEMTYSSTALRLGIDNTPPGAAKINLARLCTGLLEPALEALGVGLRVNSGYRSPRLNAVVGGSIGSAHLDGRAADVVPVGMDIRRAFDLLRASDLPFDQLIFECGAWLHLAIARVGVEPRREVLTAKKVANGWSYTKVTP